MKKPIVILFFSFLTLFSPFFSSHVFSQPQSDEILQPLMDCLNAAVADEKAKPLPTIQGIKDVCVNELQLLVMLPPDARALISADIDTGLAKHLTE